MPISLEKYGEIRRLSLQGASSREIARILKTGRNTVEKYKDGEAMPAIGKIVVRRAPIREAVEDDIIRILKENALLPRKERMTAHDIWRWLVSEKRIAVSEGHIRKIVLELRGTAGEEFLPLEHEPGEATQIDWGDMSAYIGGVKTVVSVFVAALPYSCAICAFVYPDQTALSFADGHARAMSFWKGASKKCVYDNLRVAVKSGWGKNAIKQESFKRLEAHFGFEAVFCNRAAGWEKSNVENAVDVIRTIAFTPVPRVGSYSELQAHVDANVLLYIKTHKVERHKNSIAADFENERGSLRPLPKAPLDICDTRKARVRPDQTVTHGGVRYSVPHGYVGRDVSLRISPYHVEVFWRGGLLHKHDKINVKGHDQYVLDHYLDALSRKPRAVEQAVPLIRGVMPVQCAEFLRLCPGTDAKRQLVDILLDGRGLGRERTLNAIEAANKTGSPTFQLVQYYLAEQAPKPYDSFEIEHRDLSVYDRLIGGGDDD